MISMVLFLKIISEIQASLYNSKSAGTQECGLLPGVGLFWRAIMTLEIGGSVYFS